MKKIVLTVAVAVGIAGAVLLSASCNSNKQVKEGKRRMCVFSRKHRCPMKGPRFPQ